MKREEFDNVYKYRDQTIHFACKSCKYYDLIRKEPRVLVGKCSKMDAMDVDINTNYVSSLKGCNLFEYDSLKPLEKSISTIKNIAIFFLINLIMALIGTVIMLFAIAAT